MMLKGLNFNTFSKLKYFSFNYHIFFDELKILLILHLLKQKGMFIKE
jgi:hypothetical protein